MPTAFNILNPEIESYRKTPQRKKKISIWGSKLRKKMKKMRKKT